VDLSLNEVATLAAKAARGAGLTWGAAEDTSRSAAWLARHLGAWADELLALLENPPPADQSPLLLAGPLADGALTEAAPTEAAHMAAPIWVAPLFLLDPGRVGPVALRLGIAVIHANPGEIPSASLPAATLASLPPGAVSARRSPTRLLSLAHPLPVRFRRSSVSLAALARLQALAALTYVPASDCSRRRGAGAGLLDDE
jgi:hypothetical protein